MQVRYKRLVDNLGDAPFIACMIIVPSCTRGCKGCQNAHLHEEEDIFEDTRQVGESIKDNPFWEGIILGGLEPLEEQDNFKALMEVVRFSEVSKLFIYTSHELGEFDLRLIPGNVDKLWIKTGKYIEDAEPVIYSLRSWEVELASDNQVLHFFQRNSIAEWISQPVIKCRK